MNFNSELIDFFKRYNMYDNNMFIYFSNNSTMVDYNYEEQREYIKCFYLISKKDGTLKGIHVVLPYVGDDKTLLISIHELTHAILAYKYIGKKLPEAIKDETLPLLYEKVFVGEKQTQEIKDFANYLDTKITNSNSEAYKKALKNRNELFDNNDDYSINKMLRKSKRLIKK